MAFSTASLTVIQKPWILRLKIRPMGNFQTNPLILVFLTAVKQPLVTRDGMKCPSDTQWPVQVPLSTAGLPRAFKLLKAQCSWSCRDHLEKRIITRITSKQSHSGATHSFMATLKKLKEKWWRVYFNGRMKGQVSKKVARCYFNGSTKEQV